MLYKNKKTGLMYKALFCFGLVTTVCGSTYAQIGFGTATPNSSLDVRGGYAINLRAFTAGTTASSTDYTLIFTGTSATSVTLPDATSCTGRIYWIKNASTTLPVPVLTVNTTAAQTIEGIAAWEMDEPNELIRLVSNGTNWFVAAQDVPVRKTSTAGGAWNQGGNRLTVTKSFGTLTSHDLLFKANNNQSMRLSTSGYLGIGSINPAGRLHLVTENDDAGNNYILEDYGAAVTEAFFLRKARGTAAVPQNLQNDDLISQFRFAGAYNGSVNDNSGSGIDAWYKGTGTNNSTDMRWFTSNVERMRINENGNTGMGTSTFSAAAEKLLVDAGNTASYNVISGKGEIDNYLQLNIQNRSSGNTASSDVVATADNGDESVNYIDLGINSSGYSNSLIPILNGPGEAYLYSTGNNFVIGNGSSGYDMSFFTNGYALTNERVRITAGGNMGIGAITPADKLSVAGILSPSADNAYSIGTNAARWSEVWATNGVIQTSDERLKTNILPLAYGLTEIMQLKPVRYNWIEQPAGREKIGLIAQEVKKTLPEVVTGDAGQVKLGMNYTELVPVLINSIKQQQEQLALLRKELSILETQLK